MSGPILPPAPFLSCRSYYREGLPRSILKPWPPAARSSPPTCRAVATPSSRRERHFVPPRDPEALATADVQRFIDDPTLARTMGKRSLEIARELEAGRRGGQSPSPGGNGPDTIDTGLEAAGTHSSLGRHGRSSNLEIVPRLSRWFIAPSDSARAAHAPSTPFRTVPISGALLICRRRRRSLYKDFYD